MTRVWDPFVRLFHWSLVLSFAVAWFTPRSAEVLHHWAGYAAAALILMRLLWGVVGTRYARFSQFVRDSRDRRSLPVGHRQWQGSPVPGPQSGGRHDGHGSDRSHGDHRHDRMDDDDGRLLRRGVGRSQPTTSPRTVSWSSSFSTSAVSCWPAFDTAKT